MSLAIKFMNAFRGSEEAHGQTTVGAVGRNGKTEANSRVVREPLTEELVRITRRKARSRGNPDYKGERVLWGD